MASLAAGAWIFGTANGARWLLAAAARGASVTITAKSVEGQLAQTLKLRQLHIRWTQGNATVDELQLSARPWTLLGGTLRIPSLTLKNVAVTDNAPEKPPVLKWPKVSGLALWLGAAIDHLDIENLTYRHLDKQPLVIKNVTASVKWTRGYLSARDMAIVADPVVLSGQIRAGFSQPLLEMDVTALPSQPPAGMERFHITGAFSPGKIPEQIAGNLRLSGCPNAQDAKALWELSMDAAMTPRGFPLRRIRLARPERQGVIEAEGLLSFQGTEPYLSLTARADHIDWTSDFNIPANLSGVLKFRGSAKQHGGTFTLTHAGKPWPSVRLTGDFSGNGESAKINIREGAIMNGSLTGRLDLDWRRGFALNGFMAATQLNPAVLDKQWAGQINFDLTGRWSAADAGTPGGDMALALRESRLHGQSLTGECRAAFTDDDILVKRLALRGKGFQVQASGSYKNRLDFTARVDDFSRLLPEASGTLAARGWLRRHSEKFSGVITARGANLSFSDLTIGSTVINASLDDTGDVGLNIQATLQKLRYGSVRADAFILQTDGTQKNHQARATLRAGRHEAHLALKGAYEKKLWRGHIVRLEGADKIGPWRLAQPAGLQISSSGLSLDPLVITGGKTESLKATCHLSAKPLAGFVTLNWHDVNMERIGVWLNSETITGATRGAVRLDLGPQKRVTLSGKASLQGTFYFQEKPVGIREALLTLDATNRGTKADLSVVLAEGGTLRGDFSSSAPAELALPDEGQFNVQLQEFDPALLGVILPKEIRMEGKIAARASGRLMPGLRLTMTGSASAQQSSVRVLGQKSDIRIAPRQASINWVWQDNALSGDLVLRLAEYGRLEGRFRLPVAARLPAAFNENGCFEASLAGRVREKGALTALFPGLIQESQGRLDLDLKLTGSWKEPHVAGSAHLSNVGGYLPTAGITIRDANATARMEGNAIHIDSFKAFSGPGHVEGSAVIRMKGRDVENFEGRLTGDRFQTIYFPELQAQMSPKLTIWGTPGKIAVSGEIRMPDVAIIGAQSARTVAASPDVVRAGKTKPAAKKLPFELDCRIKILLGESVLFKASGIDAKLDGAIDLQFQNLEKIFGRGEIRVVKGRFQTYGVNLDIVRGRLYYAGGPINQPSLDILALKTVGDVKAGVTVTGKLQTPLIKLYSDPVMQETDILAYIVLGHPLGTDTRQANLVAVAAGALLSSQQAQGLQGQIKERLGLSSFDISAGVVEKNGKMGYKPVRVAPSGTGVAASSDSVGETMVTVGRYLTPNLYVSYGRSLFTGGNLFSLRYNLSKSWQVESQTGDASGVDIYYKLEFN